MIIELDALVATDFNGKDGQDLKVRSERGRFFEIARLPSGTYAVNLEGGKQTREFKDLKKARDMMRRQ